MRNKILLGLAVVIAAIALNAKKSASIVETAVARKATAPTKTEAPITKLVLTKAAAPAVPVQVPGESEADHRLRQISTLIQVVIPTPAKIEALRPLLNDPALATEIHSALNDPKSFSGAGFTRKLRLLDAMYEGLKFPDQNIRQKFMELSAQILNEPSPDKNYLADRVEIALVLTKNFPEEARRMRGNATAEGKTAFREASQIAGLYEAAL